MHTTICWLEVDGKPFYFTPNKGFTAQGSLAFPATEIAKELWPDVEGLTSSQYHEVTESASPYPGAYLCVNAVSWTQYVRRDDGVWWPSGIKTEKVKRYTLTVYEEAV